MRYQPFPLEHHHGFTLIELVAFIIISGLLGSTILLALITVLQKTPTLFQQQVALQTSSQCMEWFIGQRHLNGFSSITCPSTTVPGFCTTPSGYTLSVNIACTTIGSDSQYKTITVTTSGLGDATISTLIAEY